MKQKYIVTMMTLLVTVAPVFSQAANIKCGFADAATDKLDMENIQASSTTVLGCPENIAIKQKNSGKFGVWFLSYGDTESGKCYYGPNSDIHCSPN